jgi:hypothetical protein
MSGWTNSQDKKQKAAKGGEPAMNRYLAVVVAHAARPILSHIRAGTCWQPYVRGSI